SFGLTVCHSYAVNVVVLTVGLFSLFINSWWLVTSGRPFVRIASVGGLIILIGLLNGDQYKLRYSDLNDYYKSESFDLGTPVQPAASPTTTKVGAVPPEVPKRAPPGEADAISAAAAHYNARPEDQQTKEQYADLLNKRAIRLRKGGQLDRCADDLQVL